MAEERAGRWRLAAWALGIPLAVAALMAIVTTVVPSPQPAGGARATEADAGMFSLQLWATTEGKSARLVAELPAVREAKVGAGEKVQVKFVPDARGGRAFAVDEKGMPVALPVTGAAALAAGSYDVFGLHDLSMSEAQALEDAPKPWPPGTLPTHLSERVQVVQGRLVVAP